MFLDCLGGGVLKETFLALEHIQTHVLAVLAATLVCEYRVRVAVVGKLCNERLSRCGSLVVLLPMLFKPAHLVERLETRAALLRSGVVAEVRGCDAEKKGALRLV